MTLDAQILNGDKPIGAAVFLTDRLGVTADHCLHFLTDDNQSARVNIDGVGVVEVQVLERRNDIDLALLRARERIPRFEARVGHAVAGSSWFGTYRATNASPSLSGRIASIVSPFECASGGCVEAMQLDVDQDLGVYTGYSGSAVRAKNPTVGDMIGLLFEQYPHRSKPDEASNVLFAITTACVVESFSDLQPRAVMYQLIKMVDGDSGMPVPAIHDVAERAAEVLTTFRRWAKLGLLDTSVLPALQARVAETLIGTTLGGQA